MAEAECVKCKIKCNIKDSKIHMFPCDSCRRYFCGDCSMLSASEIRCMQMQKRILVFHCLPCREGQLSKLLENKLIEEIKKTYEKFESEMISRFFMELKGIREEIGKKIEKQQKEGVQEITNEIQALEMKINKGDKETYSNVTKTKLNSSEVLFVRPKEKQNSSKTKSELKQKIDPKKLAISVENIKEVKGGAVIISCNDKQTKEKIKEKVENELENYKVEDGLQKDPKIIIRGVEEEFVDGSDELVLESIKLQNDLNVDELVVLKKYRQLGKRNKANIILSIKNIPLKEKICEEGKLNIGWRRCDVQQFFSVMRCFKCARYGHMATKCENNETCFKCAGMHKTNDCKSLTFKCINCSEANAKFKKSLKEDHQVSDPECECYKRLVNLEARKTKTQ